MSIDELLREASGIRLDIGCGEAKQDGFVGMDKRQLDGVDIVHDWNDMPWPLPDESVLVAVASHAVEHVDPANGHFIDWMDELWRIMKPGGEVAISLPHGSSQGFLQDPTHCNSCNETTWAYFDPEEPNTAGLLWGIYRPKPWRIKYLSWSPAANIEVVLIKRAEAISKIPDGYFRRCDGAMGTFDTPIACPVCNKKVRSVFGYEHATKPDISVCGDCARTDIPKGDR